MKGKLKLNTIEKELDLILSSPQFINSDKERNLLDYLVNKTLANEFIKEAHIAIDVFKKESNFDPALDSTVRVYMGKVRKKLENFYLSDSSNQSIIKISIPKGSYKVEFQKRVKKKRISRLKFTSTFFASLSFILLLVFIFHLVDDKNDLFSESKSVSNSPVWKEYSRSKLPTIIVVGDFFFMRKELDDKPYFIRNSEINSFEDFEASNLDTMGFEEYRHTYTPSEMSECVSIFIPHLINNKQPFNIKSASQLSWEDVNTHNIIYIGDFKTLYILNRLLPMFNIRYDLGERSYVLFDENKQPIDRFDFSRDSEGYRNENIVVAKRAGGNSNTITLIMALGRGGIDDVSQKLCDPEFLDDFMKNYHKGKSNEPFFFDIVFEIEGIEGTSLKSEIVYFNQVQP